MTLLERDRVVSDQPRAAHLTAPGIQFLRRIGVLDDIQKAGFPPKNLAYRKLDGTAVVTIEDTALSTIPDPTVVLTQNYLGNILLSHAEKTSGISINWGCRVIDVGQDENSAWAVIQQDDGTEKKITGDFLCGCDGGTSQVRKSLFGAGNFPGTTWDFQFVAADVSGKERIRLLALAQLHSGLLPIRQIWLRGREYGDASRALPSCGPHRKG